MPHHEDRETRDRARQALSGQITYLTQLSADPSASNAERLEALRLLADIVRLLDKKPHPKGPRHEDEHDHHRQHHGQDRKGAGLPDSFGAVGARPRLQQSERVEPDIGGRDQANVDGDSLL